MQPVGTYTVVDNFLKNLNVNTGANGMLEIINGTNYVLLISIIGKGTIYQYARNQAIYRLAPDVQGSQSFTVAVAYPPSGQGVGLNQPSQGSLAVGIYDVTTLNMPLQADQFGIPGVQQLQINTYQEGEIDWYPPFSLAAPVTQLYSTQNCVAFSGSIPNGGSLTQHPFSVQSPYSQTYMVFYGFDISVDENTAGISRSQLQITPQGALPAAQGWTLNYWLQSAASGNASGIVWSKEVRFPTPLIAGPFGPTPASTAGILFNMLSSFGGNPTTLLNIYLSTLFN